MTVPHSKAGTVDLIANPIRFCGLDGGTQCTPPPDIGEHTDTILREELRMSEDDIAALRRSGVI